MERLTRGVKCSAFGSALLLVAGVLLSAAPHPARAEENDEWQNFGRDLGGAIGQQLPVWVENALADEGLTPDDDPGLEPADPNVPVIVIRFYVDAPFPASNKTVIVEIYADGRIRITTIHHTWHGDVVEVEWAQCGIPPHVSRWLWGPPEYHDLTGDPIDVWGPAEAKQEIMRRTEEIVRARVVRNASILIEWILRLLRYLLFILP